MTDLIVSLHHKNEFGQLEWSTFGFKYSSKQNFIDDFYQIVNDETHQYLTFLSVIGNDNNWTREDFFHLGEILHPVIMTVDEFVNGRDNDEHLYHCSVAMIGTSEELLDQLPIPRCRYLDNHPNKIKPGETVDIKKIYKLK